MFVCVCVSIFIYSFTCVCILSFQTGKKRKYFTKSVAFELDLNMGRRTSTGGGEKARAFSGEGEE